MAGKQLSIIVQAVDQATGTMRNIANQTVNVGAVVSNTADRIDRAMKKSSGSLLSWSNALKAVLAGVTVRAAFNQFNDAARQLEEIGVASDRLQMPVDQLSKLRYVAKLANVEFETLSSGLSTAARNVSLFASTGSGKAAQQLRQLNVPLTDAEGRIRRIGELFPELLDAIARKDPARRLEYLTKIFGTSGEAFVHFLTEGTHRLRMFGEEADRLGLVFTPQQIEVADKYRASLDRLGEAWLGVRAKAVESAGPILTEWANELASFVAALPEITHNIVTVVDSLFDDRLDPLLQAKLEATSEHLTNVVTLTIKHLGIVTAAAVVDAARMVVSLAGPVVTAAIKQIWLKPIHEAQTSILADTATFIGTVANIHKTISMANNAVEHDKAVAKLHELEVRLKAAETNAAVLRVELAKTTGTDHWFLSSDLSDQEAAIADLKDEIILAKAAASMPIELTGMDKAVQSALAAVSGAAQAVANIQAVTRDAVQEGFDREVLDDLTKAVDEAFGRTSLAAKAMREAIAAIKPELVSVGEGVDDILGISRALQKTSLAGLDAKYAVSDLVDVVGELDSGLNAITWADLKAGGLSALEEITAEANDVVGFARKGVLDVAHAMSNNLAGAIVDVVSGTKSLKDAFADFASSTFKQISQLIMQFLILRAIAGIAGSFSGAQDGIAAGGEMLLDEGAFAPGGALGPWTARNGGGPIVRVPAAHFDVGGYVRGPRVGRDIVPAWLTPGEQVVNVRGTKATSPATWAYANNGGGLVPDWAAKGGGGDVNVGGIHVSVVVQGNATRADADAIGSKAAAHVADAVLQALAASPGRAQRMRTVMGINR